MTEINTCCLNIEDYVNLQNIREINYSYPIIVAENFLKNNFLEKLKLNFPDFNSSLLKLRVTQKFRKNINLEENNNNLKKIDESYQKLFKIFNSHQFRKIIFKYFDEEKRLSNGFVGDIDNLELYLQIGESCDGYETPWHVDSRNRCVVMIMFLDNTDIKSGGEFGIAKVQDNDLQSNFRFAYKKDIIDTKLFEPINNRVIFMLATPNSYHKAFKLLGKRKFIYLAYRSSQWKSYWKTPSGKSWDNDQEMGTAWANKGIDLGK